MGCTQSSSRRLDRKNRRSTTTVGTADGNSTDNVKKRCGHPGYFGDDGYDIGLRVRVKGLHQSFFVGCAKKTGAKVTIKEHHLKHYSDGETTALNEISILAKLSHPAIPQLSEVFITDTSIFLIEDYLDPYRLWNFIDWQSGVSRLTPSDVRCILKLLVSAIVHCHQSHIIIRDLSPMNILVKKQYPSNTSSGNNISQGIDPFEVKIVDFSLAVTESARDNLSDHVLFDWSLVPYCAPEVLSAGSDYSNAMDMWSLGVLIYVMLAGKQPFAGYDTQTTLDDHCLVHNIQQCYYTFHPQDDAVIWGSTEGQEVKHLITQLLQINSYKRLSAKEVLKSRWLNAPPASSASPLPALFGEIKQ